MPYSFIGKLASYSAPWALLLAIYFTYRIAHDLNRSSFARELVGRFFPRYLNTISSNRGGLKVIHLGQIDYETKVVLLEFERSSYLVTCGSGGKVVILDKYEGKK